MKKVLHNLLGIVFILICFCLLVAATIWQYLEGYGIEGFSQKYERFLNETFSLEYFFWALLGFFAFGLLSFIFWGAIVLIYTFLVKWPHNFKYNLTFRDLINTYTIIGFIMIYTWFLVFFINNNF